MIPRERCKDFALTRPRPSVPNEVHRWRPWSRRHSGTPNFGIPKLWSPSGSLVRQASEDEPGTCLRHAADQPLSLCHRLPSLSRRFGPRNTPSLPWLLRVPSSFNGTPHVVKVAMIRGSRSVRSLDATQNKQTQRSQIVECSSPYPTKSLDIHC